MEIILIWPSEGGMEGGVYKWWQQQLTKHSFEMLHTLACTHTHVRRVNGEKSAHECESSRKHIPIQCHKMETFLRVSCLQLAIGIAMAVGIPLRRTRHAMPHHTVPRITRSMAERPMHLNPLIVLSSITIH